MEDAFGDEGIFLDKFYTCKSIRIDLIRAKMIL